MTPIRKRKIPKIEFCDSTLYKNRETKLYKLFIYDDKENKWKFNENEFNNFVKNQSINSKVEITPLILFINSLEEDVKSIASKLINGPYPTLEENKIYVYGFSDRNLSYLKYFVDLSDKEILNIRPIFLALHVPSNMINHSNISNIVIQIYSFLSFICDVKIVVLNNKYFNYQVKMTDCINKMYSKSIKTSLSKQKSILSSKLQEKNEKDDDDEEFIMMEDYSDDENEKSENEEETKHFLESSSINVSQKVLKNNPE